MRRRVYCCVVAVSNTSSDAELIAPRSGGPSIGPLPPLGDEELARLPLPKPGFPEGEMKELELPGGALPEPELPDDEPPELEGPGVLVGWLFGVGADSFNCFLNLRIDS